MKGSHGVKSRKNYYEVLGVERTASPEEIKTAFRRLAKMHHPDVAHDKQGAEERFKEINEAYSVLSDAEQRSYYDRFGRARSEAGPSMDFGVGDLFGLDSIFDAFFGGRNTEPGHPHRQRGDDIRYDSEISLEEAYAGVEKEIVLTCHQMCPDCGGGRVAAGGRVEVCPQCGGRGQVQQVVQSFFQMVRSFPCPSCRGEGRIIKDPCRTCRGEGRVYRKKTLKVRFPAGVDDGSRIRLAGEGEAGHFGGSPGDLYIFVHLREHETFGRKDRHLFSERKITLSDAALGCELKVPTLNGDVKIKIPPGTQNGTIFRLKGRGMPDLRGRGHGDLNVEITVMVPTSLNEKQKKLLREFAEAGSQEAGKGFFGKILDMLGSEN
jgi:molecular chaperone DnaJ